MKFYSSVLLASMVSVAAAFSAVAPASSASATGSPDPVDRSMRGIDTDPATYDPTAGDRPAVTRNNNDQVWVQQVRMAKVKVPGSESSHVKLEELIFLPTFCLRIHYNLREPALVVTASPQRCERWSAKTS